MAAHTIGIIPNGATGRICSTQHVASALAPIRAEGGLPAGDDRIVPRLMLAGRHAEKLADVAESYGTEVACQRPSWNYRKKDGGGLILDMYPHWRYVIENTLGPMRRVITAMSTATPERIDERGARYRVDVEDNASTLIELESGAVGTILSSWATRVRRDDLLTFQIDGIKGSAIAGLHRCWTTTNAQTPRTAHFSIVTDLNVDYRANWHEV